jgi:hypothetical protein
MTQPTLPNRKRLEFVRCPICGTEFPRVLDRRAEQRWCSRDCAWAAKRQARGTPHERQISEKDRP